jgi:hypothetical protein
MNQRPKCPSGVECAVAIGDRHSTGAKPPCLGRTHLADGSSATTSKPPRSSFNLNSPLTTHHSPPTTHAITADHRCTSRPPPAPHTCTLAFITRVRPARLSHRSVSSAAMTAEVQRAAAPVQRLEATYSFGFSDFLRREYRFGLDPDRPACKAYMQGHCPLGSRCPDKHHVSSSYSKCGLPVPKPSTS